MNPEQAIGHLSAILFSATTLWLCVASLAVMFFLLNLYLLFQPARLRTSSGNRLLVTAGMAVSLLALAQVVTLLTADPDADVKYSLLGVVLWLGERLPSIVALVLPIAMLWLALAFPGHRVWSLACLILLIGGSIALLQDPIQDQLKNETLVRFGTLQAEHHLVERPDQAPAEQSKVLTGVPMQFVAAGPFLQGSIDQAQKNKIVGSYLGDEFPLVTRQLKGFWIDRHEVSIGQFQKFVESTDFTTLTEQLNAGRRWTADDGWILREGLSWKNPMHPEDDALQRPDHPVTQVTWHDALAFCSWRGVRLPTAAEWEKAARGYDSRRYPWGNEFDPSLANSCGDKCLKHGLVQEREGDDGYEFTAPVGSFPNGASPYGALDMAGNVWEFVSDFYDPFYFYYSPALNPKGPLYGDTKIVKGGSFLSASSYLRTASKSFDPLDEAYFGVGFRCAKDADATD